nr:MAG TPA: hypothetical protein [Caudoviricetes sp.]
MKSGSNPDGAIRLIPDLKGIRRNTYEILRKL